jgi:DNA-binding response OmpR family regulator
MSDADTDASGTVDEPTVLVVDDERGLADLYAIWLEGEYDVRTAYDGESALEALDDTVAVVLLDRQMPDVSGDEVLETLHERGLDCSIAMVTAVEPELDIIDLGFDDYLRKPVEKETLRDTVDRLLRRASYDDAVQAYFATARKHALLVESGDPNVTESDEFAALQDDLENLREELDEVVASFDETDYEVLFRSLSQESDDE